jgi:hypothetical protein
MRLRSSGKCGCFFVPDVNPFNSFVGTNYVRDSIERVTGKTIHPLHSCSDKSINEEFREILLGHRRHAL